MRFVDAEEGAWHQEKTGLFSWHLWAYFWPHGALGVVPVSDGGRWIWVAGVGYPISGAGL